MSTCASLLADGKPGGKFIELADSVDFIPLLWLSLISSEELAKAPDEICVVTDRKLAIERCRSAVDFMEALFPELAPIAPAANELIEMLERVKADNIALYYMDHVGMRPEEFPPSLVIAVAAIEARSKKSTFKRPARSGQNPFTRQPYKTPAVTFKTTRDVLCVASAVLLNTDTPEMIRDQLIGDISWAGRHGVLKPTKKQKPDAAPTPRRVNRPASGRQKK